MQNTELKELIVKVKNNDDVAFEELREKYIPLIASIAASFNDSALSLGSEDIYSDLFQDMSLALFNAARSFDVSQDSVTFGLYAKKCMYNRAVSVLRKVKSGISREKRIKDKLKREHKMENSFPALLSEESDELTAGLSHCLSALELSVFKLYLEGLRASEIAEVQGKDEKSVNNAIFRSKVKIRKYLLNR